jgi:hypothetical protein
MRQECSLMSSQMRTKNIRQHLSDDLMISLSIKDILLLITNVLSSYVAVCRLEVVMKILKGKVRVDKKHNKINLIQMKISDFKYSENF